MDAKTTPKTVQIVVAPGQVVAGPKARVLGRGGDLVEVQAAWLAKNPHAGAVPPPPEPVLAMPVPAPPAPTKKAK